MMTRLNQLLRYRYLIGLVLLVVSVSLELHGSSLSAWSAIAGVRENYDGSVTETKLLDEKTALAQWFSLPPAPDGTIAGTARLIRSDEYRVQTPFFLSQAATDFGVYNPTYGLSGQNMILAYNAPVKDLSLIGKPFNWGFLFLSPAKGLSFYWSFKLIGFFLLAFEFSMILTKKNTSLSLLGSLWIVSTPAIQWWFMQHLGDIVFFTLASIVAMERYFAAKHLWQKISFAALLSSSLIGFVLVIYPAFQIIFAYLLLSFFVIKLVPYVMTKRLSRTDLFIMGASVLVTATILGRTLWASREELTLLLGTVYPGQRVSLGGEVGLERLGELFLLVLLPFKLPASSNQVELATALTLLPFILVSLPLLLHQRIIKEHAYPVFLMAYSLFLTAYSFLPFPKVVVKALLFHYVPGSRVWQGLAVVGVFVSIWFVSYIWQTRSVKGIWQVLALSVAVWAYVVWNGLSNPALVAYLLPKHLVLIAALWLLAFLAILLKRKMLFSGLVIAFSIVAGLSVNPLVTGIHAITDKRLSREISQIVNRDHDGLWLSEGAVYNFPQMFGAKTLNSVRFYPDLPLMNQLDAAKQMEKQWNRYAHMQVTISSEPTSMTNPYPDVLDIRLNQSDLEKFGVDYIVTPRELEQDVEGVELMYGPDRDGYRIYRYPLSN